MHGPCKMTWVAVAFWAAGLLGQTTVQHEANFATERAQADAMFLKGDKLQALPLYEDLVRQDPTIAVFVERMGSGLLAEADIEQDPQKKAALNDRSMAAFRKAKELGDDSPLVETMLGMEEDRQRALAAAKANPAAKTATSQPNPLTSNPEAFAWMQKGETAFAKNDTATAFEDYKKAAEIDPTSYMARLYTGDACFRKGDYPCAEEWFAKAVALNPDRETAYRYWGDALFKTGHPDEAKAKYESAIVAEPYSRLSWGGLTQWGQVTKTAMGSPPIQRPSFTKDPAGGVKIGMPAGMAADDTGVWAFYAACRASTDPKGGRRSVDTEVRCLHAAAQYGTKSVADGKMKAETLGPGVKALLSLDKDGMLACWVLLNGADQDVAQDYVTYRQAHRDLLVAYLNAYVIHPGQSASGRAHLQVDGK